MSSLHSFSALLPSQISNQVTRNHHIGYFDVGVPLHLVMAEIADRQFVNDQNKWEISKSWHELLIADGHVVVEKDGEPVRFLDDIFRVSPLLQEQSALYSDYNRMLPYHLRHRQEPGDVVFESPDYRVRLVQGRLSEIGGSRWSQNLLVADTYYQAPEGQQVKLKGRIIGADGYKVTRGGRVIDENNQVIGDMRGYKVVELEPPRPGDSWQTALPLDSLRV